MRTRCFPCCSITWAATLVLFLSLCSAQARNLSCVADDDTVYATLHRADLLIFGGQKARQLDACWKVMNDRSKWIDMSKPAALPISPKALEVARIAAASTSSNLFTIFDRVSQVESNQVHVFAGLMYWREHGGHPAAEVRPIWWRKRQPASLFHAAWKHPAWWCWQTCGTRAGAPMLMGREHPSSA